jgi:hypothetical protein
MPHRCRGRARWPWARSALRRGPSSTPVLARLYRVQAAEDLRQQLACPAVSLAGTLRIACGPWLILAPVTMQQPGHLLAPADDFLDGGNDVSIGASSMYAWQFAKLQHAAELHGWTPFVSMQNQYNLLRRQDEPELMAMCADMGVGVVPYSPQGKGRLARPWGDQSHRCGPRRPVFRFTARRIGGQGRPAHLRSSWRHYGSSRAGLGAEEFRHICTHRRGNEAAPSTRSDRSARPAPHRRGDRVA